MRAFWLLIVVASAGCAQDEGGGGLPFETYERGSGPSSVAALDGTLGMEGGCLIVRTRNADVAIVLPADAKWDRRSRTITLDAERVKLGDAVSFGGQPANLVPRSKCASDETFVVGSI